MGGGACVCGGGVPLAFFNISGARFCSESHLYISKTKKTLLSLGVTQQVSAASFLSHKFTHQSKDPVLCFLSTLCLSVCLLSLCTPGRWMRVSWRRLKEGSAFQSELFPEESRYVRTSSEVRVIW